MNPSAQQRPVHLAGSVLDRARHVCAFFHSRDEEYRVLYLRGGHFDQNAMLALIEEVLTAGKEQGFPLTRLVANMEWALEDRPGVADIVEYKTRLRG